MKTCEATVSEEPCWALRIPPAGPTTIAGMMWPYWGDNEDGRVLTNNHYKHPILLL